MLFPGPLHSAASYCLRTIRPGLARRCQVGTVICARGSKFRLAGRPDWGLTGSAGQFPYHERWTGGFTCNAVKLGHPRLRTGPGRARFVRVVSVGTPPGPLSWNSDSLFAADLPQKAKPLAITPPRARAPRPGPAPPSPAPLATHQTAAPASHTVKPRGRPRARPRQRRAERGARRRTVSGPLLKLTTLGFARALASGDAATTLPPGPMVNRNIRELLMPRIGAIRLGFWSDRSTRCVRSGRVGHKARMGNDVVCHKAKTNRAWVPQGR